MNQLIRDQFISYKMASPQTDECITCVDLYLPIEEGSSKHVQFQILYGDILSKNADAVVVFKSKRANNTAEGESL